MARKRNSFVITEIKDYKKGKNDKKKDGRDAPMAKKLEKKTKKDKNFSKIFISKAEIETNETIIDKREETTKVEFKPKFKTNRFLKKCFESRREKGMILLSPKVEQKIYKLKKSLRKKGLEESAIIDIIRKRRREEEIKYNKEMNKNCFKCRQNGHFYVDCPFNTNDNDGIDICYRCGSSEHKLSECRQKSEGLPFAKCFICQEVGHLTRDCSQNTRGVYPKGGECKACHSVNHLIKDCPQNQKDEELEKEITLPIVEDIHSVDAEVVDNLVDIKTEEKPKKLIKF